MMQIIAFGILLYCGMEHFDVMIGAVDFVLGIVMPFLVGGAIAFVINVPMKSIERHLFAKNGEACKMEKTRCLSADACACVSVLSRWHLWS